MYNSSLTTKDQETVGGRRLTGVPVSPFRVKVVGLDMKVKVNNRLPVLPKLSTFLPEEKRRKTQGYD